MNEFDDCKWFLVWSHGRAPKRKEKYKVLVGACLLFSREEYEDEDNLKARVLEWATDTWPTSEHVSYGWKEVERLPDDVLLKELGGAQNALRSAVDYLAYLLVDYPAHLLAPKDKR